MRKELCDESAGLNALEKMTHDLLGEAVTEFGLFAVRYELTFHNDEEEPDPKVIVYDNDWGVPDGECLGWAVFKDGKIVVERTEYAKNGKAIGKF